MNKTLRSLAAAALAAALAAPASALVLTASQVGGGSAVVDYSGVGQLSFDLDFATRGPVLLQYRVEAGDLLAPLAFDAIVRNFTGTGFDFLGLQLYGAEFDSVGSVTRAFGTSAVRAGDDFVELGFTPLEFLDVELGDVLGGAGKRDWTLSLAGRSVGDVIGIRIEPARIPEPATPALLALALGAAVFARKAGSRRDPRGG